jgi:RND family efflux transporter MFP subunit
VNLDPIRVTVPVPDRHIQSLKPGESVQIDIEFIAKGSKITGQISYIIPQGNEKARTFPVHVLIENRGHAIMPGMSARVHFPIGEPYEALLIHKDAFSGNGEQDHVFVIRDGKAERVSVKKGRAYGSLVVTEGQLSAGELVVVEGNERLMPGQEVEAVENKQE